MIHSLDRPCAHPREVLPEGRVSGEISPEDKIIQKISQKRVELGSVASRCDRADRDVVLA